jgi:hypothetical protein
VGGILWLRQAEEVVRRNQDRDERLKAAEEHALALAAEAKRLEQQRAQLEAELAEAHRDRCSTAAIHEPHLHISDLILLY